MSEHIFGPGRTRPANPDRVSEIAKRHGADFIEANMPGTGYQNWFIVENYGDPFNAQTASAVWADLEREGLANEDGLIASSYGPAGLRRAILEPTWRRRRPLSVSTPRLASVSYCAIEARTREAAAGRFALALAAEKTGRTLPSRRC